MPSGLVWKAEDEFGDQTILERIVDNGGNISWMISTVETPNGFKNAGSFLSEQDLLKLRDAINVEIFGG